MTQSKQQRIQAQAHQRQVSFNSKQKVKPIPSLSSFTESDISAIWYSRVEIETVTHQANELVLEAEENLPFGQLDYKGDSIRGLERKTEDGHAEAFLARVSVYDAVLDEQDRQWNAGIKVGELDLDAIARACSKASTEAKFAAFQRAKTDESVIQGYLVEPSSDESAQQKRGIPKAKLSSSKKTRKQVARTRSACSPSMLQSKTDPSTTTTDALVTAPKKKAFSATAKPAPAKITSKRRPSSLDQLLQKEKAQQLKNVLHVADDLDSNVSTTTQQSTPTAAPQNKRELDLEDVFANSSSTPSVASLSSSWSNFASQADDSWVTTATASLSSWDTLDDDVSSGSSQASSLETRTSNAASGASSTSSSLSPSARNRIVPAIPRPASKANRSAPLRRTSTFKRTNAEASTSSETSPSPHPLAKSRNSTLTPTSLKFPSQEKRMEVRTTKVAASRQILAQKATRKRVGRNLSFSASTVRMNMINDLHEK